MTALGITALNLRIADFKFIHKFVIPDTEIIFGTDVQIKRNSQFHMLRIRLKTVTYKRKENSLHTQETVNRKATMGIVKLTLKILPQPNGVVPIKITGQAIKEHMPLLH